MQSFIKLYHLRRGTFHKNKKINKDRRLRCCGSGMEKQKVERGERKGKDACL